MSQVLEIIQKKRPEYHPAETLADIACDEEDPHLRLQAAKALMPYVAPQMKSVDLTATLKDDYGVFQVLFE